VALIVLYGIHIKIRSFFADRLAKKWVEKDPSIAKAILRNTVWWKPMLGASREGWQKKIKEKLDLLSARSKSSIRKLNDQFIASPDSPEPDDSNI
jgi:hypothetical protein